MRAPRVPTWALLGAGLLLLSSGGSAKAEPEPTKKKMKRAPRPRPEVAIELTPEEIERAAKLHRELSFSGPEGPEGEELEEALSDPDAPAPAPPPQPAAESQPDTAPPSPAEPAPSRASAQQPTPAERSRRDFAQLARDTARRAGAPDPAPAAAAYAAYIRGGGRSKSEVRRYQRELGLPATGRYGADDRARLLALLPAKDVEI